MKHYRFFKYHALGNDMLVIDPAHFGTPLSPDTVRRLCHRHFGLGADGICHGPLPGGGAAHRMRFFNPDGSEAEKSGNGLRIFARYLWDQGYAAGREFEIEIHGQIVPARVLDDHARQILLGMGRLSFHSADTPVSGPPREVVEETMTFDGRELTVTAVSVGNPHAVIFVDAPSAEMAQALGPTIETAPLFPNRTNVQFAQALNRHTLRIEIWERGAGYTLASGTSASAAAGAAVKTDRCDWPVTVQMAGGSVVVDAAPDGGVTLTGPVQAVARGSLAADLVDELSKSG